MAMALWAVVLSGCGGGGGGGGGESGGGGGSPTVPVVLVASLYNKPTGTGSSTAATYGGIGLGSYSEHNDALSPTGSAAAGLLTVTGALPLNNAYGGIQAVVYPPASTLDPMTSGAGRIAAQDYHSQTELRLVAGSAGATRLQVQLIPQGGPFNGCVPTAQVAVQATPQTLVVALNSTTWVVPTHCTAAERTLTLSQTLAHLSFISVGITTAEVAGLADGQARSFTLGEINFAGPTAAPVDLTEVVTVFNRPMGVGDSLIAVSGGLGFDLYSELGNATSGPVVAGPRMVRADVAVPAGNGYGGLLLQSFGPGSTWAPMRGNLGVGNGVIVAGTYSQEKRLRIQVGSTSATQVIVRLNPQGGPLGACVPTFLLPVDAMTVSRDIALADTGWFVPTDCSDAERAVTAQQAVSNLRMVAVGINERSVPGIADGVERVFTLGEIAFVH